MKKDNGFTLAEVLVAIVIGVISVAAAFSAYNYYTKSYDAVTQKSAVNSSAREALTLITKDLRNAGYIDPNFLSASCENITTERQARLKLLSVSSRKTGLSGKYGQSDFLAIWTLDSEVKNGGYDQYFLNNGLEYGKEAINGFIRISAKNFATLTEKAIEIFEKQDSEFENKRKPDFDNLDDEYSDFESWQNVQIEYIRENYEKFIVG